MNTEGKSEQKRFMHNKKLQTLETQIYDPQSPLEKEIVSLGPWFHNLHFEGDIQTAPNHKLGDFPRFKWEQISPLLPQDLAGWKVLDIGCNAGYYTFELAKKGADVLGIDIDDHYLNQARWAAEKMNLADKVKFRNMQVYDVARMDQSFDLILFMGLFYHLRYPLLALDIVARKFKKYMIFQTMTMPGDEIIEVPENFEITDRELMLQEGFPKVAFIEKALSGDFTNWWAPNSAAVEAVLRSSGLVIESKPAHEIYFCTKDPEPFEIEIVLDELSAATGIKKFMENE